MFDPKQSGATERLMMVMMQIAISPSPISVQQLSDQLQIPKSSLYRHLALLREWNLIMMDPDYHRYTIGPAALALQHNFSTLSHLSGNVERTLVRLQQQTGEMAAYMVPMGFQAMCVDSIESLNALRCSFEKGKSQPLIRGASSKVMLAHMEIADVNAVLDHFLVTDIAERDRWHNNLEAIRTQGFAISNSEFDSGVSGVSAPVLHHGKLVGAVSIMAPEERVSRNRKLIVDSVLGAAVAIAHPWRHSR
ncbi:IclR family transcriptional regulator [Parasalinivibrio latis]|uniref:IclR family transcriptional regulator n=1 Tax=Parasalinivibrio latis TaxID=2952610 RepID=UPI0030DFBAE5